ncbi:hypothetical protein BCV73_24290 [Paenibacillus sp. SSG-1]|uniref:AAA family ATPase n=1 Tax=Paenibacillus sp. SSG-1 TaxID=1443669 RepID=UPI000B7FB7A1|nr:DUF3696 domain-containing protein [Paenibacillus sp. SSG-1]OXL85847.1 hypothetical protein BCV73_24290 [Paenibacillus sp. SSG-1]
MIKNWTLKQFKSVFEQTNLDIAPLTIFTGANNSGKSTIIQSMLLTAQTIQNPVYSRAVVLNGHIARLGTFEDIATNKSETKEISIGFELSPTAKGPRAARVFMGNQHKKNIDETFISCNYTFTTEGTEDVEVVNLNPILNSCSIKLHSDSGNRVEEVKIERRDNLDFVKGLGVTEKYIDSFEDALQYEVIKMPSYNRDRMRYYRKFPNNGKTVGASLQHFLPNKITLIYDLIEEDIDNLVRMCIYPGSYYYRSTEVKEVNEYLNDKLCNFILDVIKDIFKTSEEKYSQRRYEQVEKSIERLTSDFKLDRLIRCYNTLMAHDQKKYSSLMEEKESKLKDLAKANKLSELALFSADLPDYAYFATDYIIEFFANNVKYLGPLRDEPKPIYPHTGTTDSRDVGYRGEHTAAVLEIHKNTKVNYITPPEFNQSANVPELKSDELINAVLDWLNYMGVVSNVKTIDRGKLGHELKVSTNDDDEWHDLTHVGVGVSQVLPILVLSLLAPKGSTLIFEQPELHLHPRVQTRLADFFVSMSNLGKQCIVETHSEYLINRLRYHAVVSEDSNFTEKIIMYFVEKELGKSKYKPVKINKYGVIEEWPKGFFDENEETSAAIIKAAMNKRKKESQQKQ